MVQSINDVLEERGKTYGNYLKQTEISTKIENAMHHGTSTAWNAMKSDQRDALRMIAVKISRIVNGDPDYGDNWHDIAGYATLVADRLDKEKKLEIEYGRKRIEEGTTVWNQ